MNRKQIKQARAALESRYDYLMSRGYGGSDDPAFKRACEECRKIDSQLISLAAAANKINEKSRNTRRTNKWVKA